MDAKRATELFKLSDELYQRQQYHEALRILAELNKHFPIEKNVIWPSALCLQKLGRHQEAANACDILVAKYNDSRALDLKQRLAVHLHAAAPPPLPSHDMLDGPLGLDAIDAMLDRPDPAPRAPRPVAGPDYKKIGLIAGGVVVVLLLLLPLFAGGGARSASQAPPAPGGAVSDPAAGNPSFFSEEDLAQLSPEEREALMQAEQQFGQAIGAGAAGMKTAMGGLIAVFFAAVFLAQTIAMYATFAILNKLPSDEVSDNILDILLYSLIGTLLSFVPIIGFIVFLIVLSKHYNLSCGELVISVISIMVLSLGFIYAGMLLVGGSAYVAGSVFGT